MSDVVGKPLKVLVTGANGLLGRSVVTALIDRGHRVRAMVRPATDVSHLHWPNDVEIFRADLRVSRELQSAFEGIDVLVHLAAVVTGGEEAQLAGTVIGTERLLDAMARSQARRIVFAGTFSVYDWSTIRRQLTEDSPLEQAPDLYERDGYAIAKMWQERVVRRMTQESGWDLTVLRPGFIWGKGNEYLFGLGQRAGPLQLLFGARRRLPLTYVENCADVFAECVSIPAAAGQTFNVVDSDDVTVWRYAGQWMRRTGKRGVRIPVPYSLATLATRVAQRTSKLIFHGKGKLPSILVPCRFEARFKPLRFPNTKLRTVLGWKPKFSFEEALERTYEAGQCNQPAAMATVVDSRTAFTPSPSGRGSG
ncbi:MAG TPA: NAD(P)-dependent oxidoreductase [Tepidisphaeraceae bacterium]|nr:NAD(P)-dependent oxidoreductase [Tepidisphaeraceae bacterium]